MTDLIRNALETIAQGLETWLQNLHDRGEPWVALTNIANNDGSFNKACRDKIILSIYNITRETTVNTYPQTVVGPKNGTADSFAVVSPPLFIDLHVMVMANFSERAYVEGLAALSRVISYFQQNPSFNPSNAPGLHPAIQRLNLDFENLTPVDVNYIMSMMGAHYLPSAFYKIRLLPFVSNAMQSRAYAVTGGSLQGSQTGVP